MKSDYSNSNQSFEVDQKKIYCGYVCAIAAFSEEDGLVLLKIVDKPVDRPIFIKYLYKMHEKIMFNKVALFMDQLKAHTHKETREVMDELKIQPIINAGYSPQFNGAEGCFSVVKHHFKKAKMNWLVN